MSEERNVINRPALPPVKTKPALTSGLSKVVVPHATRWFERIGAYAVFTLIRVVSTTLRYRWSDRSGYFDKSNPTDSMTAARSRTSAPSAIYCVWHNRLALCMIAYFGYVKQRNQSRGLAAMVSASKDGGFLSGILECFGVLPVRGSTSRRGRQALLELTTCLEKGYDAAITPDGPRGPRYIVQDGVISLAQLSGRPIVPVTYNLGWKIRLRSWDGFQIPLPFSRCEMIYEKPVHVPRDATGAQREALRRQLEETLKAATVD